MRECAKTVVAAALTMVLAGACVSFAQEGQQVENRKEDIWSTEEQLQQLRRYRFGLSDELIDRVLEELKKTQPAKARELAELRKKNPEKVRDELRKYAREELGKVFKELFEERRRKWHAEFLQWLKRNREQEAADLAKLEQTGAEVYEKKLELVLKKYRGIFEAWRRNPQLGAILLKDHDLKVKRDELVRAIKTTKDPQKKRQLSEQLKMVLAERFDLIVQRKQMAYEQLLKRLQQLQQLIEKSKSDIAKWRNPQLKAESVQKRLKDLLESKGKFPWD